MIKIDRKHFQRPTQTFKEEATMSYTVRRSGPRPPEKLTAIFRILGHELPCRLYARPLGLGDDLIQQINYVPAVCCALVGQKKRFQNVLPVAYLALGRTDLSSGDLPDADRRHIRQIVLTRDRSLGEDEMERIVGRFQLPNKVQSRSWQVPVAGSATVYSCCGVPAMMDTAVPYRAC
jgi:hypothetical protein